MERMYWPTAQWQTANPAVLKMDTEKLSMLDHIIESEYSNTNGIVIVKNGYIAYERHYNGYGPDDALHVASVTKSVLSALVGIAINKGFIKSTDQKVLDFFPEYTLGANEKRKQEICIKHLLTMTAPYLYNQEPFEALCSSSDWAMFTISSLDDEGKIGSFKYSTAGAHLLSTIITRSTGKSSLEFANEYLFRPIGMKEIPDYEMKAFGYEDLFGKHIKGWVKDPNGNSTGGWGLTLTPRDMARFGFLYLNQGFWDNQQVIPQKWIDETIAMNANNYGYLWWLFKDIGTFAYCALGDGGNVICCVPEKDMVIAIQSECAMNARDRLTLIKEHIIPAVID